MKDIILYTDGACSNNPGKGGYGAILIYNGSEKIISGNDPYTTNNRMELLAVIEGLKGLKEPCNVTVYTDSAYVCNAFLQDWITNWQAKNWVTASKKPVQNIELWKELLSLTKIHNVGWVKVKGHSDNHYNNRCDEIARNEILKI